MKKHLRNYWGFPGNWNRASCPELLCNAYIS